MKQEKQERKAKKAQIKGPVEPENTLMADMKIHCLSDIPDRDKTAIYASAELCAASIDLASPKNATHIITLGRCPSYAMNSEKWIQNGVKVVLPEYFDDCFRLGMICPPDQYLFPNPAILELDPIDLLSSKHLTQAAEKKPPGMVPGLFSGKSFFIARELTDSDASENGAKWVTAIEKLGGKISASLENASTVIVDVQGELFEMARNKGKEIGTKRWVRDQLKLQKIMPSSSAVLYYPHPEGKLPEMKNMVITVSNYVGEAREDIFNMALRLGAQVTRTMSAKNTHLICASPGGEKYARAHLWNMHIVNHLWIENTYAKWVYQREAKPKYLHFPVCIRQLVNKTPACVPVVKSIEEVDDLFAEPKEDNRAHLSNITSEQNSAEKENTKAAVANVSNKAAEISDAIVIDDAPAPVQVEVPLDTIEVAENQNMDMDADSAVAQTLEAANVDKDDERIDLSTLPLDQGTLLAQETDAQLEDNSILMDDSFPQAQEVTPQVQIETTVPEVEEVAEPPAPEVEEKEGEHPVHQVQEQEAEPLVPEGQEQEAESYEPEVEGPKEIESVMPESRPETTVMNDNAVQNVVEQVDANQIPQPPILVEAQAQDEEIVEHVVEEQVNKRPIEESSVEHPAKRLRSPFCILFTGVRPSAEHKKTMLGLGLKIVATVQDADVIVASKIARTEKFLLAIAKGVPIVHISWMHELFKAKKMVDPTQFELSDETNEQVFGFKLKDSLGRARSHQLLAGYSVYCLPKVEPSHDIIMRLVTGSGGQYKGILDTESLANYVDEIERGGKVICFIGSDDKAVAKKLQVVDTFSTELLLTGILTQTLDFEKNRFDLA